MPFEGYTEDSVTLDRYLRALAHTHLDVHGDTARPRLLHDDWSRLSESHLTEAMARSAWRWLAFALPPDLLLGALGASRHKPHEIELISRTLAQQLDEQGFAETHLHVGAGLDFPLLWHALLHAIAGSSMPPDIFVSPGAALHEGHNFTPWLLWAAVIRYILAMFLKQSQGQTFRQYFDGVFRQSFLQVFGLSQFALLRQAVVEAGVGDDREPGWFHSMRSIYARLTGVTEIPFPTRVRHIRFADPIVTLLPRVPHERRTPEMRLIADALTYLERPPGDRDLDFAALFWQVVRVRSLFYRHVIQRPMTPGLQWFVRFYGRIWPARSPLGPSTLVESSALLGGLGQGLRSLEFRTAPQDNENSMRQYLRQIHEAAVDLATDYPDLELGLVYHFIKRRDSAIDRGMSHANWRGSYANPAGSGELGGEENPYIYRYAVFYRDRCEEAQRLKTILRQYPLALLVIRGLDVCTDELGVPNWVFAPILQGIREVVSEVMQRAWQFPGLPLSPLHTTAHSGEDFVHLLTGLRNVDQTLEYLRLREGDRIGHSMSLGIDPREWARRAGRIPMFCEDRLFDLVLAWGWYAEHGSSLEHGRHGLLEHDIARLSDKVFGHAYSPYELKLLQVDLGTPRMLRRCRFPGGADADALPPLVSWHKAQREAPEFQRLNLLRLYLTDREVFRRGRGIIWVNPAAEAETLARLQSELRAKIGTLGVTVEVNPTSNLLIGDLSDLSGHPIWRLRPPHHDGDAPPVSICIGSDDPLTFASNLRQEYQALCDAMTLAGLSEEEARQWLDRTRAAGMESRFTLRDALISDIPKHYFESFPAP